MTLTFSDPEDERDAAILQAVLTPEQYADLTTYGVFTVFGSDTRNQYHIVHYNTVLVKGLDRRGQSRTMCAVPRGRFSTADHIAALALLIRSNEKLFLETAAYKRD